MKNFQIGNRWINITLDYSDLDREYFFRFRVWRIAVTFNGIGI